MHVMDHFDQYVIIATFAHADFLRFWTLGLSEGVHSNHPCPSISPSVSPLVRPSVFKYLGDRSFNFSETLHEVRGQ